MQDAHLGFWWEGTKTVFIEEDSGIFPSRGECLRYLQKFFTKDRAVDIITSIKNANGNCVSF